MANMKNFGLDGVAGSLQLGKGGQKIESENGKIVAKSNDGLSLVPVQAADPVSAQDVVTKILLDSKDGMSFVLGEPTDGSLSDGAVPLTETTTVTNAVDQLNEILGKLVPAAPLSFPAGQSLSLTASTSGLLASGAVPNNTAGGTLPVAAGAAVIRTTTATFSTSTIGAGDNVGPGTTGTVQSVINNVVVDSLVLTEGIDSKTTGVLRVTNNQAYPVSTPGFWESFRSNITNGTAIAGWNRARINQTAASATPDLYFVYDNLSANPAVSNGSVTEGTAGTLAYSSGVPHYGTGASLNVSFDSSNLSGETYKSGTILSVAGANSIFTVKNYTAGQAGLAAILPRQVLSFSASNLATAIDGTNVHNSGQITATASNVNGNGSLAFGPTILVKRGTTTRIDEMNIPVSIAINGGPASAVATRVAMATGNFPATSTAGFTVGDWSSSAVSNTWEAGVVGGILSSNQVNYTTGFLPVGPDRSAFAGTQYVTFLLRRTAVSKFDISVTGTYTSMFVKLPGLSEANTASENGWYNMGVLYGGAGKPGNTNGANGSLGCALGSVASGTGSWTATFGTLSSTDSNNNIILVRFVLAAGQSISALSFIPSTR